MTTLDEMPVGALANWFGRDGEVIDDVAAELDGCGWIGVGFGGGLGALSKLKCNQGVATDLHHHIVNCAAVCADPMLREQFMDRLAMTPCSDVIYNQARERCMAREQGKANYVVSGVDLFGQREMHVKPFAPPAVPDVAWAVDYFIVSWMGQGGRAGTEKEFINDSFSVRFKASGGSSSSRWRSALASFPMQSEVFKRWTVVCMDVFELLDQAFNVEQEHRAASKVKKVKPLRNGLYLDPPFPEVGEPYTYGFTLLQHEHLSERAARFMDTRVVMRFHEHPLVRELYTTSHWTYIELKSRSQGNNERSELLLVNGPSRVR